MSSVGVLLRAVLVTGVLFLLSACGRGIPNDARIVVAGDSVMAWNRVEGASVAHVLRRELEVPVGDVSMPFARIVDGRAAAGLDITAQVRGVEGVDWVLLNGGANDLYSDCGCSGCGPVLDRLIGSDGTGGAIPEMVGGLRASGARVVWAAYYTSPRYAGTACVAPFDELKARLGRMAAADDGVILADMGRVLPSNDLALFARDRVHPSEQGSDRMGRLLADVLRAADTDLR
jgi:acyl-CoA thioesterase-1